MKVSTSRFLAILVAVLSVLYAWNIYTGVSEPDKVFVIIDQFLISFLVMAWAFTGDK